MELRTLAHGKVLPFSSQDTGHIQHMSTAIKNQIKKKKKTLYFIKLRICYPNENKGT